MSQVQIDLDELDAFLNALKTFNAQLDANWDATKTRWQNLLHTRRDPECARFLNSVGWLNVQLEMQKYLEQTANYVFWLEQRAQPLRVYREQASGSSSSQTNFPPTPPFIPKPRPVEAPETGGGSPERGG